MFHFLTLWKRQPQVFWRLEIEHWCVIDWREKFKERKDNLRNGLKSSVFMYSCIYLPYCDNTNRFKKHSNIRFCGENWVIGVAFLRGWVKGFYCLLKKKKMLFTSQALILSCKICSKYSFLILLIYFTSFVYLSKFLLVVIRNFWNIDVQIVIVEFCSILTNCFTLFFVKGITQLIFIFYKNQHA